MKIALILPAEGPQWGSIRIPNLGNAMICEATRKILQRVAPAHLEVEEFTYLKRPSQEELQRINSCDLALFVGTNIFQAEVSGWDWHTEDFLQIEVPYAFYGVGYSGPLHSDPQEICEATRDLINWARGAIALSVRDPHTLQWLRKYNVLSDLTGCPVLDYAETFSSIALGQGKPVLAIRQILLHNPDAKATAAQQAMVDWFFKEYPDGICVVQEPADLSVLQGRCVATDLSEIVQVISQARFVLSARLHAGMLALVLGRPAIFLAHDTRVASFCEMIGLPSRQLSFEGLGEAIQAIRTIEQGDLAEFNTAVAQIPLFRERLERFLAGIVAEKEVEKLSVREARRHKLLVQIQSDVYELKQELVGLKEQLQARDKGLAALKQELVGLKEQLQARDKGLAALKQELVGLKEQLRERNREIEELRQVNADLKEQLQTGNHQLAQLRQELDESQRKLTAIYSSTGWKLLDRYWRWMDRLLPVGTRRRRWYNRMTRAVQIVLSEGWRGLGRRLKAKLRSHKTSRHPTT